MEANSYNISNVSINMKREIERLRWQVELFWESESSFYDNNGLKDNLSIIEFGCGPGFLLEKIHSKYNGILTTGVEIDPLLVDYSRNYLHNYNNIIEEGSILDFNSRWENKYDIAIVRLVLEHLPNPDIAIKNVFRSLKNGGIAFFIDNDFEMHVITSPPIPLLDKLYEAYSKKRMNEGGNPYIGRLLPNLLSQNNFYDLKFSIMVSHNFFVPDDVFLKSEGIGIPLKLVKDGYLDSRILAQITREWSNVLKEKDHIIMRQLYICCGRKDSDRG